LKVELNTIKQTNQQYINAYAFTITISFLGPII